MNDENANIINAEVSNPWLSVIIPIYNAEKYLSKCLDSILNQNFTDFEVLLIDDGSTDSSPDICKRYAHSDRRFKYIRKENGGAYQTRLYGAKRAQGTYITFCDADDFYKNKYAFARLHEEVIKTNCSAIQFGYIKKYNHLSRKVAVNKPLDIDKNSFLADEYPKLLCSFWESSHLTTSTCNKAYHKSLISNLPDADSAERVFWGDDQIMNLHLLSTCESFRFIPETLYCYRQFSGGTSGFSKRTMKDVDIIKKYQLLFLERYTGTSTELMRKIIFSELTGCFFGYVQQALDYLDESKLTALINDVLQYPRFLLAKEYYMSKPEENREAVNLLRKGDACEYIRKAKEYKSHRNAKDTFKKILKQIYTSI